MSRRPGEWAEKWPGIALWVLVLLVVAVSR